MYIVDIDFILESPEDVQCMLNYLYMYGAEW